jgi:hypothetical protein
MLALKPRRQGGKLMQRMAKCNQPSITSFTRTMIARLGASDLRSETSIVGRFVLNVSA